jgi:hypothetical protein
LILDFRKCAVLCGVEDWKTMSVWGCSQLAWLRTILPFANSIPSPDTFRRVFAALNSTAFERCFIAWVGTLYGYVALRGITVSIV